MSEHEESSGGKSEAAQAHHDAEMAIPDKLSGKTPHLESPTRVLRPEREHEGPIWKHPYFAYIIVTMVLFLLLVLFGWVALTSGWIPNRRVT